MRERYFLDTFFVQAVLSPHEPHHARAVPWRRVLLDAQLWTTEAVLVETANAMSRYNRAVAVGFIQRCYTTPNITVVPVTSELFTRGLKLYAARPDKEWGLTDCLSFVAMRDHNLHLALTGDAHFEQAGFRAVLRA